MKHRHFLLGLVLLLILPATACGTSPQLTNTPVPITRSAPTNTPEPFVGSECDPGSDRVEMNTHNFAYVAGSYTYREACSMYCLWVPDGSQLKIGISDFKEDLNLHMDVDLLDLHYGNPTCWESTDYGPVNELVYIPVAVTTYGSSPSKDRRWNSRCTTNSRRDLVVESWLIINSRPCSQNKWN